MEIQRLPSGVYCATFWLFGYKLQKDFATERDAHCFFENLRSIYIIDLFSIEDSIGKYLETVSRKKSMGSQIWEKYMFSTLVEFLTRENLSPEKPITEVSYLHLENYQSWLIDKKKLKPATVNRYFSTIKHFFKKMYQWGAISKDPAQFVCALNVSTKKKNTWPDEVFLDVYGKLNVHDKKMFLFLKLTGARASSASLLKWSDVDYENLAVHLTSKKGANANHKIYKFPLHTKLKSFFNNLSRDESVNNFVFLSPSGSQINSKNFAKRISKVLQRSDLKAITKSKHYSLHGLRHTLATEMQDRGLTLNEVKNLLGHSSVKVTEKYVAHDSSALIEKMNKLA